MSVWVSRKNACNKLINLGKTKRCLKVVIQNSLT